MGVASPSSPPLVRYCSVTDNSSAALCSSQMTTMTWPLQGAPSPALRPFLLLCAIGHETNTQRPLNGVHFAASTTRFSPLNRFEGAIEMSSVLGPPPMPQRSVLPNALSCPITFLSLLQVPHLFLSLPFTPSLTFLHEQSQ